MDKEEQVTVRTLPKRMRGSYSSQKFQKVEIITNFYHVQIKPVDEIHIFRIKFSPQIALDDRSTRRRLIEQAISEIKTNIQNPVFSGFNIYSLTQPINKQFTVKTQTHQISIKQVKVLKIKQNKSILVQFLNNGLRNLMSRLNYAEIGRTGKFFNIKKNQKIENLLMYSGYKANFMQLQKGIYLRVDTAKKIVRNQTVLQYIDEIYRQSKDRSRDEKRQTIKQELLNKIIMTNYGKTRYLRITDIQFVDIDETIIPNQKDNFSIRQYYQKRYNLKIENAKQPMLIVEQKRRKDQKTYMVPEFCLMTGIPDGFEEHKRKKISQATIRSADERKQEIGELMGLMQKTSELNSLQEIGIKVNHHMERFDARIIPPPRLRLGNQQKIPYGRQSQFQLFSQPIFGNKHALQVGVISFKSTSLHELLDVFESTSRRLAVKLRIKKISAGEYDGRRAITALEDCIYKASEKEGCNICLIIIPNQMKTQYKQIKQLCLLTNRIVCQIATEGTLRRNGFKSIATKILLQLIAKRGNTLWVPESATELEDVMLAAFDTAKFGKKNVIAGVATINSTYSSICSKIEQYTDVNSKLHTTMIVLLQLVDAYVRRNKSPPKQIILFANSCSADQVKLYKQFMINPIIAKFGQLYGAKKPNLTVTLVNTKTSERFFQAQGNTVKNVPAGTIVSEKIVSEDYDFFMVSQFATTGCTVPNHYKVIHNDSKMEEGVLQELVYSQCFNYVNWTGSIKVPGILQYAKKCVKFSTDVLENRKICEELQNKLYFI